MLIGGSGTQQTSGCNALVQLSGYRARGGWRYVLSVARIEGRLGKTSQRNAPTYRNDSRSWRESSFWRRTAKARSCSASQVPSKVAVLWMGKLVGFGIGRQAIQ